MPPSSPLDKALKALAVYLRRGYEAEEAWTVRGADALLQAMNERAAAFHNFRCFEDQARRAGVEVAHDPEVRRLMALAQPQNEVLARLVDEALTTIGSQLARLSVGRNAARAYHSGTQAPARYLKQS